jgi:hypothetical protein
MVEHRLRQVVIPTRREASCHDVRYCICFHKILDIAYHARAWKGVPAETNAISILYLTPLVLDRLVIHYEFVIKSEDVARIGN